MYLLKVANSRKSSEYVSFTDTEYTATATTAAAVEGGGGQPYGRSQFFEGGDYSMFTGYSQTGEMSAMVTALTHVVSGQKYRPDSSGTGICYSPSSAYSSSSSGSRAGQKRRSRDQEEFRSGWPYSSVKTG